MKIGIDCRQIYDVASNRGAGVERYTYNFVRTLVQMDKQNDYVLFFLSDISSETVHKLRFNNPRVRVVKLFSGSQKIPFWDSHVKFSHILKNEKLDLAVFPATSMPLFYNQKSIIVVHDLAIYLHPEWFPSRQWFAKKIVVPSSLRKAAKIIAVSSNTKEDLIDLFHLPEEKIKVIYPGVKIKSEYLNEEIVKVKNKFHLNEKYLLFIGTIEPRKNIVNLMRAFSNYVFDSDDIIQLVLAGGKGWKYQPILQEMNELNKRHITPVIKYIGQVSNRERNILIKSCHAFAFPSLYEGFGFPVVEAMTLRVPVLAGNNSSMKEICAETCVLVDPENIPAMVRGIRSIVNDVYLRQNLVNLANEKAKQFTWQNNIEKFIDVMRNLM